MKFDLKKKTEQDRFNRRCKTAIEKGWFVDLTNKTKGTPSMNSYFHLICAYFGTQTGYTKEYVKQTIVKQIVCPDVFNVEKVNKMRGGEMYRVIESWADIGHEKQNHVINKFINWSWETAEIRLPNPDDLQYIREIQIEVDRNKQYL